MTKVLIIVDMQKGFKSQENQHIYKNINKIDFKNYEHIFATRFINKKSVNPNYQEVLNYNKMITAEDTELSQLDCNYVEIEKTSYSLPQKALEDIKQIYENSEDKEIHIAGTDYDSCVLAIGFQLFDNGLIPRFYRDVISARNVRIKLDDFEKIYTKNFGNNCFIKL